MDADSMEREGFLRNIKVEKEKFGVLYDFLKKQGAALDSPDGGTRFEAAEDVIEYAGTLAADAVEESKKRMDAVGMRDIKGFASEFRNYQMLRAEENAILALYRLMPRGREFLADVLDTQIKDMQQGAGRAVQKEGREAAGDACPARDAGQASRITRNRRSRR